MEKEREIDGRSVETIVKKPLGYIQGRDFVRLILKSVKHELMLADRVYRQFITIFQTNFDVIGRKSCIGTEQFHIFPAQHKYIGKSPQNHAEVALETAYATHTEFLLATVEIRLWQTAFEFLRNAHRTGSGTTSAMWSGKGFVQIEMQDVKAHIPRTHNPD